MESNRYVLELAYNGTNFAGWQRQPNAMSVEEAVDTALSLILGEKIKIVGCGRTDAGVHAAHYIAHFDYGGAFPPAFLRRYNRLLVEDVAVTALWRVPADFHARFHASGRSYVYQVSLSKEVFRKDTVASLPQLRDRVDQEAMQSAAALLLGYKAFAPFCKTKSDNFTMDCDLTEARWDFGATHWTFHISANRFLRGMVRLIAGMCIRVGQGLLTLEDLRLAMDEQTRLPKPWSAPAEGLFLSDIRYPNRSNWEEIT